MISAKKLGSWAMAFTSGRRWYARENGILGLRVAIVASCSIHDDDDDDGVVVVSCCRVISTIDVVRG